MSGEHEIAPLARAVGVAHRIVERGSLGQRRQRRRLREREPRCRDAEVVSRRLLDSVPAMSEVDLVEICLENLLLVVVALHLARGVLLVDLARDRAVGAIDEIRMHVADELLRDRARATRVAAQRILDRGGHADHIHTIVLVEALVFDRDERLPDVRRQRSKRHAHAELRAQLTNQLPVAREHERRLRLRHDLPRLWSGLRAELAHSVPRQSPLLPARMKRVYAAIAYRMDEAKECQG